MNKETLVSVKIIPMDQGFRLKCKFTQEEVSLMKQEYAFKSIRNYAFKSYEEVDAFIRSYLEKK